MANEARINSSLRIVSSNLTYQSDPRTFNGDVTTAKGPSPGAFSATTGGVDVDLGALATPAYCRIQNLDSTNYVTVGLLISSVFYPYQEVLAGETYVIRLSRTVGDPAGTADAVGTLHVKADTATCYVVVEAFEA